MFSKRGIPWILFILGGFLGMGGISNAVESGWDGGDVAVWWVMIFVPIGAGIILLRRQALAELRRQQAEAERAVMVIARASGGMLMAADLAHYAGLTLDEAQASMRHLARRGFVTPALTDDGEMVYELPISTIPDAPEHGFVQQTTLEMGIDEIDRRRRIIERGSAAALGALLILSVILSIAATIG